MIPRRWHEQEFRVELGAGVGLYIRSPISCGATLHCNITTALKFYLRPQPAHSLPQSERPVYLGTSARACTRIFRNNKSACIPVNETAPGLLCVCSRQNNNTGENSSGEMATCCWRWKQRLQELQPSGLRKTDVLMHLLCVKFSTTCRINISVFHHDCYWWTKVTKKQICLEESLQTTHTQQILKDFFLLLKKRDDSPFQF